jgi:phosphinothricin acetyltransferase
MSERTIRAVTGADARAVRDIYAPYVETPITFETAPPAVADLRERIEGAERYPWLVCETEGEVVGYAAAGRIREQGAYRWAVESSVYVAEGAHGRGVGRALYEALLSVLRLQGYLDVHALVTLPNPASVALHESVGFERVATFASMGYKNGAWHDVSWWRHALRERPGEPEEPLSVPEARELAGWEGALG